MYRKFLVTVLEVHERRRSECPIFQKPQRGLDNCVLALRVARCVERIAVAKWDEQGARRAHALRHVPKKLDRHGPRTLAFQLCRDQAHGLVAHGSDRHQQRDIHGILHQPARGLRRGSPN